MKIIATKVKAKELKAGELFSTADQSYWDNRDKLNVGERVYIRTEGLTPKSQEDDEVYRIEIKEG
jgi:hypothetical protein